MEKHDENRVNNSFIITLTGPSMSGKSYVMNKIEQEHFYFEEEGLSFNPVRVKKYTTRSYRIEEIQCLKSNHKIDIKSVPVIPENCDLVYRTYGQEYGLSICELEELLKEDYSPIIVINDVRVVEEIKQSFPGKVLSLFLFRKIPELKDFKSSSALRGNVSSSEVKQRYSKAISIYRTYIENITLFDRVILNVKNYQGLDGETDYTRLQLHNVIKGVIEKRINLQKDVFDNKKKLFIISGSAASGKDEIIRSMEKLGKVQTSILSKYTTRMQEPDDGPEMICKMIPKKTIMASFQEDFISEFEQLKKINEPPDSFVNEMRSIYIKVNNPNKRLFDEFISLQWEAEKLKKLRNILTPEQRFWKEIESVKKSLKRRKKSQKYIMSKIQEEYFELNDLYKPIEDFYELNEEQFLHDTKNQEIGVSGPACYIETEDGGYVLYKNNKDILYAFKLSDKAGENILTQMNKYNKHYIIAASLTEIFNLCKRELNNQVVTIFAYSQISAENYKKRSHEHTALEKAAAVDMDIERYSKYIEYFDHVSIFAESVYKNKPGGADEELVDQIFRLLRAYN